MQKQYQKIFESFLGNNNEYFLSNCPIVKPKQPPKSKELTDYEKRLQNQTLDSYNPNKKKQLDEKYKKYLQKNKIYEKDNANFIKEMNSFLNQLFEVIFQNEQNFFAFEEIQYQLEMIQKNVCFLIGSKISWNYENLFREMNCNIRAKEYKLDDYRIQESPFKERELQLRIVKPLSQRNGERQNNTLGDFILLQIIDIQSDSNPNNLYSERIEQHEEQEQNNPIDSFSLKQEDFANLDGDNKQLKNEYKKIPISSILPASKAIIKNKSESYRTYHKEEDADSNIIPQIQTINQGHQQNRQIINNAADKYYSSHNFSNQESCSNYDSSNRYQSSTKNAFNTKQESDEDDNVYKSFNKEDLVEMLKERDALDKFKWIQEGIEKVQNFKKDLSNQNHLIQNSRFPSNQQK
ncbi:hypothetical protein TTHERM_00556720 (macronuclear) [Tetrahymena thermophila SB210]|uniref:Uncharacterized protein n=1 Tax=Tetrahymena thermophila (strain SB210) TaxID=312017 RepID=I7M9L9_TETTS|nr:hypothetical protein TTHERM_00556720 [Tetrahymena thermophila SB210]EAS02090.1 hypothetical protein TTHERM_00556720 [Tetrahymena thermophila SB210]|eukprot:XP_001022335.1 hypothetical protein TTHERM_00556720 [Tetrahymena thermophila SB210]